MLSRRTLLVWLACACAGASAWPASPTVDPLVVTRVDDSGPSAAPTTEVTPTTAAPPPPLKLTSMDVQSEVSMRYAHTAVVTHVRNPANQSQEAVFRVLIPETAFISGFEMTLEGVTYKAYVKGKEEAKQIYDQAVSQGTSAGLVAVKARDSNQFVVSVNVAANTVAKFNLTYEELLVRRSGVYNHDINLHPGALVPALTVRVHIRESQAITTLRVPEVRTGNEVDATDTDPRNAKAVIERSADNREATITFKPDLEEQKRLMQVYAEKTKESQQSVRRYSTEQIEQEGVLGQFVVQYDVERPKDGDILVNDGYFVHFFAPENLPPLKKLVVFVLDTSGSMMDRKIVQLREAMQTILSDLNAGDYFSIVEFNTGVKVHDLKEADQEPPKNPNNFYFNGLNDNTPVVLLPPFSADKENIAKAKVIVSRLVASGGTNINGALDVGVNIALIGVKKPPGPGETAPTLPTEDTQPTAPTADTRPTGDAYRVEPYRYTTTQAPEIDFGDDDEKQELESIIVFLTDGEPTVGETDPKRIINRVTERNSGPRRATIFSLAFGEDADRAFLRKLSLRNAGFMRHIYEAADAPMQLHDFYAQISSPLLDDVTFVYPPGQVKELTKQKFRTYYAGSEVVVAGKLQPGAAELTPQVLAFCGVEDGVGKKRYEVFPRVPVARAQEPGSLERLYVSLRIKQLLDQKDAADDTAPKGDDDPEKIAKDLALQYSLVTPLTSLVVVKPNATNAVDAQSADEPNRPFYGGPLAAQSSLSGFPSSGVAYASFSSFGHGLTTPFYPQAFMAMAEADFEPEMYEYDSGNVHAGQPGAPGGPSQPGRPGQASPSGPLGPGTPGLAGKPSAPPSSQPQQAQQPSQPAADQGTTNPGVLAATDPLQVYHLENYAWTKPLIDASSDQLVLPVNGTTTPVKLKLTKDNEAPKEASDAPCARATDGGAGVCVYMTRCGSAQTITRELYSNINCSVAPANVKYAGVCCPSAQVDQPRPTP